MFLKIIQRHRCGLLIHVLAGCAILALLVVIFFHHSQAGTVQQVAPLPPAAALPSRLLIPALGVTASIESLGLTAKGDMAVPTGPLNVAWFSPGTLPGDIGSAVIAGHEGWKNNIRAVFDNLYKLQVGDKVYVQDANGATKTFTVRALRTYAQDAATSDVFTSGDGKRHLNLITCEGLWNSTQKSYPNRLVVFTVEE